MESRSFRCSLLRDELIGGSLVPLLTDYRLPIPWLNAHYADTPHMPLKTRLFLERISERYRTEIPWERRLQEHVGDIIPALDET